MPQNYPHQQNYYNPQVPVAPNVPPVRQNQGFNPPMQAPPPQHGYSYPSAEQPYNPYYSNNPPPNVYGRYPPYGGPPPQHPQQLYMNKPVPAPYYANPNPYEGIMRTYGFNLKEAQLFNEGYELINQIKSPHFTEQ